MFKQDIIARDDAPASFAELMRHMSERGHASPLTVWAGASERTIWGDPVNNWQFRGEHDALHAALMAGFDMDGERRVAIAQCKIASAATCERLCPIIWREVVGQAEYYERNGEFPADQIKFQQQEV